MDASPLLALINREIIHCRGLYSQWSAAHNLSYNEMLIFYTIRDKGFCTQKQICDSYLLPRQTINHAITELKNQEIIVCSKELSAGRERAFVLTEKGKRFAEPLCAELTQAEKAAAEQMGMEKLSALTELMTAYNDALMKSLTEKR